MIDITPYQQKLKALSIYMDWWLSEKHCIITWWDIFNQTGNLPWRPEWLPPFDEWYEAHKNDVTN
jgi:hypothetical protein